MADFTYSPDFGYKVKPTYNVIESQFENGFQQRRLKHSNKLRTYELTFTSRLTAEMTAVLSFFDTKKGSLTAFTINIDGADVTGIIAKDSFWATRVTTVAYDYGFTFQEVLA